MRICRGTQFIFVAKSLHFNAGAFEPIFCSVYLYDFMNKRKLSEDFHFDLNDEKRLALIGKGGLVRET